MFIRQYLIEVADIVLETQSKDVGISGGKHWVIRSFFIEIGDPNGEPRKHLT